MTDPIVFRDGYTRRVLLKGKPGLHGDAEFQIRPLLVEERDELSNIVQKNQPRVFNLAIRNMMAKQVVGWNATDAEGLPVPLTPANFGRMPPSLYDRLYWVLIGRDAGDLADDASETEQSDYAAQLLAGSDEGDAKN